MCASHLHDLIDQDALKPTLFVLAMDLARPFQVSPRSVAWPSPNAIDASSSHILDNRQSSTSAGLLARFLRHDVVGGAAAANLFFASISRYCNQIDRKLLLVLLLFFRNAKFVKPLCLCCDEQPKNFASRSQIVCQRWTIRVQHCTKLNQSILHHTVIS